MDSEERRGCCGVIDYRSPVIAAGWQLWDNVCQQRETEIEIEREEEERLGIVKEKGQTEELRSGLWLKRERT